MRKLVLLCFSLILFNACAFLDATHKAEVNENDYPISMTSQLFDEDLNAFKTTESMEVGKLKIKKRIWNLGGGTFPLGKTKFEFSDEINQQIEKAGGNAVVYFKIDTEISTMSNLTWVAGILGASYFHILSVSNEGYFGSTTSGLSMTAAGIAIPFIMPGYNTITVTGSIVKVPDSYWK